MQHFETLIRNVQVVDGSGQVPFAGDVAVRDGRVAAIMPEGAGLSAGTADCLLDGSGLALSPGFIDAHTHDDTVLIRRPDMLPKISQGVTTVVVGNCGISAAPVTLRQGAPDPMQLLGPDGAFCYPRFADYVRAVEAARPAVNVAALVGHTALRNNHMDRLDRSANEGEIALMRAQLADSLQSGALGLSTGLAYASAQAASTAEVKQLAEELRLHGGIYATHLRSEFGPVLEALDEAYAIALHAGAPLVVSHLKCAGLANWGRSGELLASLDGAARYQPVGCDCYPYSASSSTLDLAQVTEDFEIFITWSDPEPQMAGQTLQQIAQAWGFSLLGAAKRLQPAGAIYHGMDPGDVERILSHPMTMIGSDGLPEDPHPHPRLWGTFPRVIGHYGRTRQLFTLAEAVRKMTSLPAQRFGLKDRGLLRPNAWADLVLFDPKTILDTASFQKPQQYAVGIHGVWVNGVLSFQDGSPTPHRGGRFLKPDPVRR